MKYEHKTFKKSFIKRSDLEIKLTDDLIRSIIGFFGFIFIGVLCLFLNHSLLAGGVFFIALFCLPTNTDIYKVK